MKSYTTTRIYRLTHNSKLQGKLYIRGDSKIFRFQNGKSESLFLQRKNPRRIAWTVLFRRQHRKGISEVRYINTLNTPPSRLYIDRNHFHKPTSKLSLLTSHSSRQTGSRQETHAPHRQATTWHRRCLPRRNQRAPLTTTRSPCRSPTTGNHCREGKEDRG